MTTKAEESLVEHQVIKRTIFYSKPSPTWAKKVKSKQSDLSGEIIKSAPEVKRGLFKVILTEAQKETFDELEATKSKKLFERQEDFLERKLTTISLNKATLLFLQRHEILPDETFSEVVNTARAELEKQLKKTLKM